MANVKFSQFTSVGSIASTGFLVGYDSVTNLNTRVTLANLKTSIGAFTLDQTLVAGSVLTASRTINANSNNFIIDNMTSGSVFRYIIPSNPGVGIDVGFSAVGFPIGQPKYSIFAAGTTVGLDLDYSQGRLLLGWVPDPITGNQGSHIDVFGNIINLETGPVNKLQLYLDETSNTIRTYSTGFSLMGLDLNFSSNQYSIGYFDTSTNQDTYFRVEKEKIQSVFNNNTEGIDINFTAGINKFGFFDTSSSHDTYLNIQPQELRTIFNGTPDGIDINFSTQLYKFGGITSINIDSTINTLESNLSGVSGFSLDGNAQIFKFGDWNAISNNSNIVIDSSTAANIVLQCDNPIALDDNATGNMIANTSSGSSGNYLVIVINGTTYKIALDNN